MADAKSSDESVSFTSAKMDSTPQNNVGMIRVTNMEKNKKGPSREDSNAVKAHDSDDQNHEMSSINLTPKSQSQQSEKVPGKNQLTLGSLTRKKTQFISRVGKDNQLEFENQSKRSNNSA